MIDLSNETIGIIGVLALLVLVFIGVILFAWRPGSRRVHGDAARSIFRNERRPAPPPTETEADDGRE